MRLGEPPEGTEWCPACGGAGYVTGGDPCDMCAAARVVETETALAEREGASCDA